MRRLRAQGPPQHRPPHCAANPRLLHLAPPPLQVAAFCAFRDKQLARVRREWSAWPQERVDKKLLELSGVSVPAERRQKLLRLATDQARKLSKPHCSEALSDFKLQAVSHRLTDEAGVVTALAALESSLTKLLGAGGVVELLATFLESDLASDADEWASLRDWVLEMRRTHLELVRAKRYDEATALLDSAKENVEGRREALLARMNEKNEEAMADAAQYRARPVEDENTLEMDHAAAAEVEAKEVRAALNKSLLGKEKAFRVAKHRAVAEHDGLTAAAAMATLNGSLVEKEYLEAKEASENADADASRANSLLRNLEREARERAAKAKREYEASAALRAAAQAHSQKASRLLQAAEHQLESLAEQADAHAAVRAMLRSAKTTRFVRGCSTGGARPSGMPAIAEAEDEREAVEAPHQQQVITLQLQVERKSAIRLAVERRSVPALQALLSAAAAGAKASWHEAPDVRRALADAWRGALACPPVDNSVVLGPRSAAQADALGGWRAPLECLWQALPAGALTRWSLGAATEGEVEACLASESRTTNGVLAGVLRSDDGSLHSLLELLLSQRAADPKAGPHALDRLRKRLGECGIDEESKPGTPLAPGAALSVLAGAPADQVLRVSSIKALACCCGAERLACDDCDQRDASTVGALLAARGHRRPAAL